MLQAGCKDALAQVQQTHLGHDYLFRRLLSHWSHGEVRSLSPLVNLRLASVPALLANHAGGKKGADFSGLVFLKRNPVLH